MHIMIAPRPKLSKSLKVDASKIALRTAEDLKRLEIDITLATVGRIKYHGFLFTRSHASTVGGYCC